MNKDDCVYVDWEERIGVVTEVNDREIIVNIDGVELSCALEQVHLLPKDFDEYKDGDILYGHRACDYCGSLGEFCECETGYYVQCGLEYFKPRTVQKQYCFHLPITDVYDSKQKAIDSWNCGDWKCRIQSSP